MKKWFFQTSLYLFFSVNALAQSGWTQPKGSGYFKLSQYSIVADQYFSPSGDIVDITTTGFHSTSIYGEYGITDKFTLIAYVPFFVRSTLNRLERPDGVLVEEGDELNAIGDADLSVKYRLLQKGAWASAVTLTLGFPLGEPSGGDTGLLQSGDGEFNQMLTLSVSRSFGTGNTYASALVAFNNRTENFSDEFRYGAEFGGHVGRFWLIGRLYAIESLQNGDDNAVANNGIFNNNLEYISFSPEVVFEATEKFGVTAGIGTAFSARRVLAAPAFTVGVYWQK